MWSWIAATGLGALAVLTLNVMGAQVRGRGSARWLEIPITFAILYGLVALIADLGAARIGTVLGGLAVWLVLAARDRAAGRRSLGQS